MTGENCRHRSWMARSSSGAVIHPTQEGLTGAQVRCTDGCGQVFETEGDLLRAKGLDAPRPEDLECLDSRAGGCTGATEFRVPLSGTGESFPRCDGHWADRLKRQEEIVRRYAPFSDVAPDDFDPTYAGEQWDEEY